METVKSLSAFLKFAFRLVNGRPETLKVVLYSLGDLGFISKLQGKLVTYHSYSAVKCLCYQTICYSVGLHKVIYCFQVL